MALNEDKNRPSEHPQMDAHDAFLCKERPLLLKAARHAGLRHEDAEDVAHEVIIADILRVQKNGPFAREEEEHRWLLTAVRHRAVDVRRRSARRRAQPLDALSREPIGLQDVPGAMRTDWNDSPFSLLNRLCQANNKNAWLLVDHFWLGRPIQELADDQGCTANAISKRMQRLLRMMRGWMSEDGPKGMAAS